MLSAQPAGPAAPSARACTGSTASEAIRFIFFCRKRSFAPWAGLQERFSAPEVGGGAMRFAARLRARARPGAGPGAADSGLPKPGRAEKQPLSARCLHLPGFDLVLCMHRLDPGFSLQPGLFKALWALKSLPSSALPGLAPHLVPDLLSQARAGAARRLRDLGGV